MKNQVHTHSNRYLYVTNEKNKTFNSLKEFGIDQGLPASSKYTIFSGFFYDNLVDKDGNKFSKEDIDRISDQWHSEMSYEFQYKNPNTNKIITVRRLKRFRGNELN